jgi:hypothetical protein
MQFEGRGATSDRQGQWFLHHYNSQSHTSLVVQQFLSSPSPVLSGSRSELLLRFSVLQKWDSEGQVSQPWRASNRT